MVGMMMQWKSAPFDGGEDTQQDQRRNRTSSISSSSSESSDDRDRSVLSSLEYIHLILPKSMTPIKLAKEDADDVTEGRQSGDSKAQMLRGYETLQELRHKTVKYRQAYLNWRLKKPHGARGETSDVISGRTPAMQTIEVKPASELPVAIEMDKKLDMHKRKSFHSLAEDIEVKGPPQPTVEVTKTVEEEEAWLRFYFNPFVPAAEKKAHSLRTLASLEQLKKSAGKNLRTPKYDRSVESVTHWIMHLGVGQFHRSHQLVYMDDLLELQHQQHGAEGGDRGEAGAGAGPVERLMSFDTLGRRASLSRTYSFTRSLPSGEKWGYCGVGLTPYDAKMANALKKQNLLYTVLTRSNATSAARVVGSMFDYIFVPNEMERAFARLIDPSVKIVSLTVTEKGYYQNVNGDIDIDNALVKSDLELLKQYHKGFPPRPPQTAIGFLCLGLRERRRHGMPPFTVMSCDNLPENGRVARHMVLGFTAWFDVTLQEFVASQVSFVSTMVDRITPVTMPEHKEILETDFSVVDEWPVVTEDYRQWVIEDNFPQGRPQWEAVGALLCTDVRPFEIMKLRLLNGGHSMVSYASYLAGYKFVDDAVDDINISSFLRGYMDEVSPTVHNVTIELERYKEKIVERFGNRMMKDLLLRICEDGSTKFFNTTKDALIELIAEGRHIQWCSLGIACWIAFLASIDPQTIKDGKRDVIVPLATLAYADPAATHACQDFLRSVFGEVLGTDPTFVGHVAFALYTVKQYTAATVLKHGGALETAFSRLLQGPQLLRLINATMAPPSAPIATASC